MNFFANIFGGPAGFHPPHQHPNLQRGTSRKPVYFDSLNALPEEFSEKSDVLRNSNKGKFIVVFHNCRAFL